jgi:hypothetical protein
MLVISEQIHKDPPFDKWITELQRYEFRDLLVTGFIALNTTRLPCADSIATNFPQEENPSTNGATHIGIHNAEVGR